MGSETKIQWCDYTFNPWIGCTKVAAGCANCYAEADFDKRRKRVKWGPAGTRVKTSDEYWRQPLKWNKEAQGRLARPRVFCASLADVFEKWDGPIVNAKGERLWKSPTGGCFEVGKYEVALQGEPLTIDDLRRDLFALIDATPHLDWLLVTKRPERIRRLWPLKHERRPIFPGAPSKLGEPQPCIVAGAHRRNVWLLTSVSDQHTADGAIPELLLKCRDLAPVLGVSAEPLLGPIEFEHGLGVETDRDGSWRMQSDLPVDAVDWVIVGGESGPHARPCHVDWIRAIRDQCKAARTPCFVKQLGAFTVYDRAEATYAIRDPKGGDPAEWPADLRVREFPRL